MNIFTSYKKWFINTMDTIIQVAIIKYDISQYRLMRNKIQRYIRKMERLETPEEKQKMMNIIEVSKLQLNAFPSLQEMYEKLNNIFRYRPYKEQFNKNSFQLKEEMTNIQKRKFDLLRWIRNSERSLFQLFQVEHIKNNSGKSIRQKRNENHSREELKNNWLRLVLNVSSENIRQAYQRTNERTNRDSQLLKSYNYGLKQNNFNLSLNGKKKHLKTNECSYDFEERTNDEKRDFLNEIERKKRNNDNFSGRYNWETTLDMLGINQLSFLQRKNQIKFNPENAQRLRLKKALKELINLYLMPIQENYTDVFLLYRENIMMCISFILYDNNYKIEKEGNIAGRGLFGNARLSGNKIFKYENLRIMSERQRKYGIENNKTLYTSYFKKYPINSYETTHVLFSYMIQKYLYELNHDFVPNIEDIKFDFEHSNQQISQTTMNIAKRNNRFNYENSSTLFDILFNSKYYTFPNYMIFIKNILIKLCDILIYYQNKCYFIHHDFHIKNIIVNFNLIDNELVDIENIKVKLIDFAFSSIIINNNSLQLSQFEYINLRSFYNPTYSNPYLNNEWKKIDFKYFFILLLFYIPKGIKQYNIKNLDFLNNQIILFFKQLINLDASTNYFEKSKSISQIKCLLDLVPFNIFLKKNKLSNFFDPNFDDNIFEPSFLKDKLLSI